MAELPKVYCFVHPDWSKGWPGMVSAVAIAEDGTALAQHVSSNALWARSDIGYLTDEDGAAKGPGKANRARFVEHYPEGFEAVWVDRPDPLAHAGVALALERNRIKAEREKA